MKRILLAGILCTALAHMCLSQTQADHLTDWLNNKYSMFIHFGVYSELGGVWKGKNIDQGYSEQIQSHAGIFSDEYESVASHFLPSKFNADSIVLLAKRAGMRSVVVTSKHHDGFCMFKTQTTNFNIVDATPFKRDVVKELSEACKRHGLNFGLYFSLIDWHYPQAYPVSSHNADFITPEHHEFSKKQLQELLTNYGSISELWFDMGSLSYMQSNELRTLVKKFQPQCLISGRLGNDQGDFCVMGDNEYPDYTIDAPWQVPASMYDETWGYRSWQKHVAVSDKASEKLKGLIRTVTRGGNYLLNIGPKGDGSVVDFEQKVLMQIGSWLKVNGEAIYETKPVTSLQSRFGEMTTHDNRLYFFLFDTPANNQLVLKGIASKINKVYPLDAVNEIMSFKSAGDSVSISLKPDFRKGNTIRVIVIESEGNISLKPKNSFVLKPLLTLNSQNAQHHYSFSGVDYYSSYRSTTGLSWDLRATETKKVVPTIFYSDEEQGREIDFKINGVATPVYFTDGAPVLISNVELKWGNVSITKPEYGFIHKVDISPKNLAAMKSWTVNASYRNEATMFQNIYWLQDVAAPVETQTVIQVPTNDGVAVYLNGKEVYVINNPLKSANSRSTVLLSLKAGTNKLLIKYFNRFAKEIEMGVFSDTRQVLYKKDLPAITFEKDKTYQIGLKLPSFLLVHQNIRAPNVSIQLTK